VAGDQPCCPVAAFNGCDAARVNELLPHGSSLAHPQAWSAQPRPSFQSQRLSLRRRRDLIRCSCHLKFSTTIRLAPSVT
jgi:hypothetical protein